MQNCYEGIVEKDVCRLVVSRARRMQIPPDQIDDLQQQIIPKLAKFKFDPSRANGASRTTVLTSVIDHQIKAYLRARSRYAKRIEELQTVAAAQPPRPKRVAQPEPLDLRMDLAAAMATLSVRDRKICQALAAGMNVKAIAKELHCGRDTVGRAIERIRETFCRAGMRAWVEPEGRP